MPLATPSEARAEFARNAGADEPERAWILTPWDTWEANPSYRGPPVRHPEDDSDFDYGLADPWRCGDCGADTSKTNGWCLSFGCCGLGGATPDGRLMAHQDKVAAYRETFGEEPAAPVPGEPAVDEWDMPW